MDRLKDKVHLGCGRNEVTKLTATGIPPHIVLANEIVEVRTELKSMRYELIDRLCRMPEAVANTMRDQFTIEGAVQLTRNDVQSLITELEQRLLASIGASIAAVQSAQSSTSSLAGSNGGNGTQLQLFHWGGKLHPVPENFELPR